MTGADVAATGITIGIDRDWLAILAAMLAQVFSIGTLTIYSFGVFVHPLHAEFGWSRTQLSGTVLIMQYAVGLSSPFWGGLVDRFGARAVLIPTAVAFSLLVASVSLLTPHLWHLDLVFFLIAVLGPSPVLYPALLIRLFARRLGLALGLTLVGVGIGATIVPPLSQYLITALGWRGAYLVLGALALAVGLPAALIATRHAPGAAPRARTTVKLRLAPFVLTRTFTMMLLAIVLLGIVCVGTVSSLVPLMMGRGFTAPAASKLAGLIGLALIFARGVTGWLLDQVSARLVLVGIVFTAVSGLVLLVTGHNAGFFPNYPGVIILGIAMGAEADVLGYLTRLHFPQAMFGRLFGLLVTAVTIGGGTGPLLMGLSFDHLGSYRPGLMLFTGLALLAIPAVLAIPRRPSISTA